MTLNIVYIWFKSVSSRNNFSCVLYKLLNKLPVELLSDIGSYSYNKNCKSSKMLLSFESMLVSIKTSAN